MAEPNLAVDRRRSVLESIFRDAEARLSMLVAASLTRGNLGTARYRANQLRQVRGILGEMLGRAVPEATQLVAQGYVHGGQVVDTVLATPRFASSFSGVHQEAVDMLADNLAAALGEATRTVGRRVEDVFRRQGLAAIAQGLATGASRREVSDDLIDLLTRQGVTGFTDKAGRNWGLSTYASMVARTTTREAVSLGTTNRMLEHGEDRVRISSHPHDKDVCTPYDGKVFSLTGQNGDPKLDRLPPFHPNCRHVVAPAAADLDQVIAELESAQSWEAAEAALGVGPIEGGPPPLSVEAGAPPTPPEAVELTEDQFEIADSFATLGITAPHDAITAIAAVHRVPEGMPRIRIVEAPNMNPEGNMAWVGDGKPVEIALKRLVDDRVAVALHEIGHYLDLAAFRGRFTPGAQDGSSRQFFASEGSGVFDQILDEIHGTEAFEFISGLSTEGKVGQTREYLLRPRELLARAYAQYIADRAGLTDTTDNLTSRSEQFSRAEMEGIGEAFDKVFRERGWLK